MNTTFKTLIAASLLAASAGLAHAESKTGVNRDLQLQENAAPVQRIGSGLLVREGRSATTQAPVVAPANGSAYSSRANDYGYNAGTQR